jgi:hypothetical protein
VKLDIRYIVHGTKYIPHVFRSSQTQGEHLPRYPNLNTPSYRGKCPSPPISWIDGSVSPSIQDHLDLGIKPNISTLVSHQGFIPPGISPMITTLGISPRVTLLEYQKESPPLGISPRVLGSRHITKILKLASRKVSST